MRINAVKPTSAKNTWPLVLVAIIGAMLAGSAIAVASGSSPVAMFVAVGAVVALFGAALIFVCDIPLAALARIGLIASFFIKAEVTVFKIDELEDPSGLNISLMFICAVVLWLNDRFGDERQQNAPAFPLPFAFTLAGLTLSAAIAAFFGNNGRLGWYNFISYLTSVFVCWMIATHFGRADRIRELVIGIALGIGMTGTTALSQFFIKHPKIPPLGTGTEDELLWTQAELFSRVSGFLRTPTEMGWVMSALVPVIAAVLFAKAPGFSNLTKLLMAVCALFGVAAIVLSLARGSWIAIVVAAALIMFTAWKNWERAERNRYFVAVAGFLLLAGLALAPFAPRIYERLTTDDGESAAIRIPLMQVARNTIADNPLVGVGLSGYRTAMYRYDDTKEHVTQVFPGTVHNSFAHVMAEIGIPGGILFGLLFLVALGQCLVTMKTGDRLQFALALGAFAAIIAYCFSALKEPGGLGSTRPPIRTMFLLFGLVMAVRLATTPTRDQQLND